MKKIAANISYFNVMDIGDKLTILTAESVLNEKKVQELGIETQRQLQENLNEVTDVQQVFSGNSEVEPKKNTVVLKMVFKKKAKDYGTITMTINGQEATETPIKIGEDRLKFLSPKKNTFIRQMRQATYLSMPTHPYNLGDSEINSFINNLKKFDLDSTKLNLVFPLDNPTLTLDLGHDITVKRLSEAEREQHAEEVNRAIMDTINNQNDAISDYTFLFYTIKKNEKTNKEELVPISVYSLSYKDIFKISKIKNLDGIVNFFIGRLEDTYNSPLSQIAERFEIESDEKDAPVGPYEVEDVTDLSPKDIIYYYKKRMEEAKTEEEKDAIEEHFNIVIKRLKGGMRVTERDALYKQFDPEMEKDDDDDENADISDDIETEGRIHQISIRNAIVTRKFSDLINQAFENNEAEKSQSISANLEEYQRSFLLLKNKFNSQKTRQDKMKTIREIDLLTKNTKNLLKTIN